MRTWVQHNVQLEGRGLVARNSRQYDPGDYTKLTNVEITMDGILRTRRPIRRIAPVNGMGFQIIPGRGKLIGNYTSGKDNYVAWYTNNANDRSQGIANESRMAPLWNPESNITFPWPNQLQYAFEWNDKFYHLGGGDGDTNVPNYTLYSVASDKLTGAPTFPNPVATTFTGMTVKVVAAFMWRERFWTFQQDGMVRWSKGLEPEKLMPAIPVNEGGGGFRIADENINYAFPLRDQVYILTARSVYVFGYSTDPLVGSSSQLTTEFGASHGCVADGVPYIVNANGIFSLLNGYPERVVDLDKVDAQLTAIEFKLVPFDDLIYLIKLNPADLIGSADLEETVLSYNIYNGSVSKVHFRDHLQFIDGQQGIIIDAMPCQTGANGNEEIIIWLVYRMNPTESCCLYYTSSNKSMQRNLEAWDDYQWGTLYNGYSYASILHDVEIPAIIPDGTVWTYKKFRHAFLEGTSPHDNMIIQVGYYRDTTFSQATTLTGLPVVANFELPNPFRLGLNQRSRSIIVRFFLDQVDGLKPLKVFSLTDFKVIWTPTSRTIDKRYSDDTPD